jgi:TonB family protein
MLLRRCVVGLVLSVLALPIYGSAQGPIAPSRPLKDTDGNFQNSAEGLRWQLQDILNSAKNPKSSRLNALVEETEIPDYADWFVRMFGREKGEIWARAYRQNVSENEKQLAAAMVELSQEDGEFSERIVNDGPAPARKIEIEMVNFLQRPVNIFFASWRKRGLPADSSPVPIGYFVFLGRKFRLDSAVTYDSMLLEPQTEGAMSGGRPPAQPAESSTNPPEGQANDAIHHAGVGGVGYPVCKKCPDPAYTQLAKDNRLEGTIVLQVTVEPDGSVADIMVIRSSDPELARMAVDGVSNWQLSPARRADGEAVPVQVPIQITFRLAKSKRP